MSKYIVLGTIVLFAIMSGAIVYLACAKHNIEKCYQTIKAKNKVLGVEVQEGKKLYTAVMDDVRSLKRQLDIAHNYIQEQFGVETPLCRGTVMVDGPPSDATVKIDTNVSQETVTFTSQIDHSDHRWYQKESARHHNPPSILRFGPITGGTS